MRPPFGVLMICGLIVSMYLVGLLVSYKVRLFNEEVPRLKDPSEAGVDHGHARGSSNGSSVDSTAHISVNNVLRQKIHCDNKALRQRPYQRGSYWVLENYVVANWQHVLCYESVTYTTHGDYTFLDNMVPLIERWRAPISIALYAPGEDFAHTVDSIFQLRNCLDNQRHMDLVRQFVSFHIYFNNSDMPPVDTIKWNFDESDLAYCSENPMLRESYKSKQKLSYPVNVARNVARDAAATHFILASDIELYPSPELVPKFLKMIANEPGEVLLQRRIFPIALYEVSKESKVPANKTELVKMLKAKTAIRFHAKICSTCHAVPDNDKWESTPETEDLVIFKEAKRAGKYNHWEPIYIGTQDDPYYDERLTWEGKSDKMTQGFVICVMDYTLALLSDVFLTHRPGFKTIGEARRPALEVQTNKLIANVIGPEIYKIFGKRAGCQM